jgi:protein O-GlcNAc transferase
VLRQAEALLRSGQVPKAVALLEREAGRKQPDANAVARLGQVLAMSGQTEKAVFWLERLVSMRPAEGMYRAALVEQLAALGRWADAEKAALAITGLGPDAARAAGIVSSILLSHDRHESALRLGDWAHGAAPADARLGGYCAAARAFTGDHAGAAEALRSTDAPRRTDADLQRDTLLLMLYCPQFSREEVFAAHRRYGELMAEKIGVPPPPVRGKGSGGNAERPLRVGYISQDFRNRSAGHFIEGIVEHHDRHRVEPWCYSHRLVEDGLTERVRTAAAGFREIHRLTDAQAAQQMRADGIDIAVDLTGHTGLNRVGIMAYRPAPVGVTYMGYAATTGLRTVDYRLVDADTDPAPEADGLATETLVRLDPCFLCYTPPPHAPEVSGCPAEASGHVTFASFNTFAKITDGALALWARVTNEVGGSRLFVKNAGLNDPWLGDRFRERFERLGGDASRLETMGETATAAEHMGLYSRVDVALDTFPYNGTTTTLEAMWMGVPVVTLEGDAHVSRVGVSLLRNAGLGDLIGADTDGYVRAAADLARDAGRRSDLRGSLRETVRSRLCDFGSFVPGLEGAYREMWARAGG